jgi:hypothetical protein
LIDLGFSSAEPMQMNLAFAVKEAGINLVQFRNMPKT